MYWAVLGYWREVWNGGSDGSDGDDDDDEDGGSRQHRTGRGKREETVRAQVGGWS